MASNSDPWTPMRRTNAMRPPTDELVQAYMDTLKLDREAAIAFMEKELADNPIWVNDLYQVEARSHGEGIVQLNIRRRDGKPIFRDWRHFQRIKNEIVGEECEGLELYPAESRLVDTSNKYHLWCFTDPTFRVPLGFRDRDVKYDGGQGAGLKQRARTV